jgi:ABC-type sugar transport system ATPase subunit
MQLLTGGLRVRHDANTIYPFLGTRDIYTAVKLVSFSTRLRAGGGEFYDYTARYGALRDSDRNTLRQSLPTSLNSKLAELAEQLDLTHLLDLPLVALSNGQTRRARILDALLASPEILVLDEPFSKPIFPASMCFLTCI